MFYFILSSPPLLLFYFGPTPQILLAIPLIFRNSRFVVRHYSRDMQTRSATRPLRPKPPGPGQAQRPCGRGPLPNLAARPEPLAPIIPTSALFLMHRYLIQIRRSPCDEKFVSITAFCEYSKPGELISVFRNS